MSGSDPAEARRTKTCSTSTSPTTYWPSPILSAPQTAFDTVETRVEGRETGFGFAKTGRIFVADVYGEELVPMLPTLVDYPPAWPKPAAPRNWLSFSIRDPVGLEDLLHRLGDWRLWFGWDEDIGEEPTLCAPLSPAAVREALTSLYVYRRPVFDAYHNVATWPE